MSASAAKTAAAQARIARVLPIELTDESVAYNVELKVGRTTIILAATSRVHAHSLCADLNECAWADIA